MTNNPYFTLTFFTRKPRSAGYTDHKVYVRITVAGQQTDLAIGRAVSPENWDQKRKMSKGRTRRDQELNRYLDEIRAKFNEIYTALIRDKKLVNPITMRDMFLGNAERPKMLCEIFTESNIKRKEEMERGDMVNATYLRWKRCVTYLGEFFQLTMNVDDIPVRDLTAGIIDDFEHFLRVSKNCANNTAVKYLRYLKNTIQYAISHKWITEDPFIGRKFHRTNAKRQFLTEDELMAIMSLDFTNLPRLETVRDTFVFCCFTGLAFCDIMSLKRSDMEKDGEGNMWIRKSREKTGELSIIPMLDVPRQIADKYAAHPAVVTSGAVIPVCSNQKMNAFLKEIATLAKISKPLTTHIARHFDLPLCLKMNSLQKFVSR